MDEQYMKIITAIMPVITAGLVAIFGVIVFQFQKSLERKLKYREEVEKRYEAYMHAIFDVMANASADNHAKFDKARASIRLFAPKDLLEAAKIFEDHITRTQVVADPQASAARLLLLMRKDVMPRQSALSALTLPDMQRLNSFKVN